jgi:hypothetical protein
MSSYPLFHSLSLSHVSSFISSYPTLSPPHLFISHTLSPSPLYLPWVFPLCLFISLTSLSLMGFSLTSSSPQLTSSSPMGFSPLPVHLPHLFISHGSFPHLFISPIYCTLNLLFKLSTTNCPNNW